MHVNISATTTIQESIYTVHPVHEYLVTCTAHIKELHTLCIWCRTHWKLPVAGFEPCQMYGEPCQFSQWLIPQFLNMMMEIRATMQANVFKDMDFKYSKVSWSGLGWIVHDCSSEWWYRWSSMYNVQKSALEIWPLRCLTTEDLQACEHASVCIMSTALVSQNDTDIACVCMSMECIDICHICIWNTNTTNVNVCNLIEAISLPSFGRCILSRAIDQSSDILRKFSVKLYLPLSSTSVNNQLCLTQVHTGPYVPGWQYRISFSTI